MNYSKEEELTALISTNLVLSQQLEELKKEVSELERVIRINSELITKIQNNEKRKV